MSTLTLYLLGAINLGIGIYSLRSTLEYRRYARSAQGTPPPSEHRPSVVLFVPCCGAEDGLEENLRSLVEQEYGPLDVVFIVEDEMDSAIPIIRRVMETGVLNPPAGARRPQRASRAEAVAERRVRPQLKKSPARLRQGFGGSAEAGEGDSERRRKGEREPSALGSSRARSEGALRSEVAWGPAALIGARAASLVTAGRADRCGQKVHNLLAGLAGDHDAEVFAFADSDGMTDRHWLANLVATLRKPDVGVASSYRFYLPEPGNLASVLRSAWNAGVLTLLGEHDRNFAWGGAMAIRKEIFREAGVAHAWRGALSDDYALTHAVRRAGYRVAFVPQSIVVSRGRVGLRELLRWCGRQMAITRVYWPNLWRLGGGSQVVFVLFLLGGGQAALSGDVGVASVLTVVLLLSGASGAIRAQAVRLLLPRWNERLRHFHWSYVLLAPVTSFLTVYAFLTSLLSRRIHWRGRVYEMRSPTETVIIG
ncbi:MAG TPA: glycosyltransferase family 2 protein [Vicinamibacteria bacterium]